MNFVPNSIRADSDIPALVAALTAHKDDAKVCEQTCRALNNLAESVWGRDAIRAAGGIPAIVAALTAHMDDNGLCKSACSTLGSLSNDYDEKGTEYDSAANKNAVCAVGGIPAIVAVLTKHKDSARIYEEAHRAHENMLDGNAPGDHSAILAVLTKHEDSASVYWEAFGALFHLTYDNAANAAVVAMLTTGAATNRIVYAPPSNLLSRTHPQMDASSQTAAASAAATNPREWLYNAGEDLRRYQSDCDEWGAIAVCELTKRGTTEEIVLANGALYELITVTWPTLLKQIRKATSAGPHHGAHAYAAMCANEKPEHFEELMRLVSTLNAS